MTMLSANEASAHPYRLIDQAADSHQPIMVAGKRSSAVSVSAAGGQAGRRCKKTMPLVALPGMHKSTRDGMAEPLSESARSLVVSG